MTYRSVFIGFNNKSFNERVTTRVPLEDVQILTVGGKKVTLEEARQRFSSGDTPIVVTSYKNQLPKFYAAVFAPDTLQFVFPGQIPQLKETE